MKIEAAYTLYQEKERMGDNSFKQQKYRIDRFIDFVGKEIEASEAISNKNLISFFESIETGVNGFYYTIKNFYFYIQKDIYQIPQSELKFFPINVPNDYSVSKEKRESKKARDIFLNDDFNFSSLFNDEFYTHLNNHIATLTLKAAFAIGLGASYSSIHISKMTLSDIEVENENVKIRNVYNGNAVPYIILTEPLSNYVIEYYEYRIVKGYSNPLFFVKHWKGQDLSVDQDIAGYTKNGPYKPTDINTLANYTLRSISYQLDIEPALYFGQLHKNGLAHYLIHTQGRALDSILLAYGIETGFVKSAYKHYIKSKLSIEFSGFNPYRIPKNESEGIDDFFRNSSSEIYLMMK